MAHTSVFKTAGDEAAYRAGYDATLEKLWPVPYEEIEVPGRFGTTHVVASGPQDAPPLVLLHGFMNTLLIWSPYIAGFSKDYRVYAIDIMGHPSKSIPAEPIRDGADFVAWLGETLDALNLDRITLAGISFGAWIALGFAMAEPQRVRKLVLLSPAASLQPLSKQFALRAVLSGIIPTRGMMDSFMKWMGLDASSGDGVTGPLLDLVWLGGQHFRMPPESRRVTGDVFSDEDLRGLQVPVLLLIGEDEVIFDAQAAMARARRLIPDLEGDLVPDSKHGMCLSQFPIVNPRVLDFLNDS